MSTGQALRLKQQTTKPARARRSEQDQAIELRDRLLMGLFIEHAFRVSEVVALDIEDFDLEAGTVTVYREKTDETQIHRLKTQTRLAAEEYLAQRRTQGRTSGPLFTGYQNKRITRYGLSDRVRLLGEQVGLDHLSPHDLRHFWTADALSNGTPVDRVQSGGNWKSPAMVLKYARRTGIANEGVTITEEGTAEKRIWKCWNESGGKTTRILVGKLFEERFFTRIRVGKGPVSCED